MPLISCSLFPPPPNPPGIIPGISGGGPMGRGDSLSVTDDAENTEGGGDGVTLSSVRLDDEDRETIGEGDGEGGETIGEGDGEGGGEIGG